MDREKSGEAAEAHSFSDPECRRAAEKAMSLLLFRDRTRRELADRLRREGFSEPASQEAIGYVEQFGYINDARYAENYIMFQKGKRSRKEMIYRLTEKGIDRELILRALEEDGYEGEEEAIMRAVVKKLRGREIGRLSEEERRKIMLSLARKGYDYHAVKKVFSQLDN